MEQDCSYRRLENGIHEFSFHRATTKAVDEWIAQTTVNLEHLQENEEYRAILFLLTGSLLPINYFMTQVRAWQKEHPDYQSGRIAVVYDSGFFLGVAETLTDLLIRRLTLSIRFFAASRSLEAMNWLLTETVDL
jgi:hypothetical protein